MGRTIPTSNQYTSSTINDLSVIKDYLNTDDKPLWDEFMTLGHLNERAIANAVFTDPLQAVMLAQLFKIFKVVKKLGGEFSEWQQQPLDEPKESADSGASSGG
jgi:hypothetical protein